jgi:peptide/nickel transport system substrate-binding protein
MKQRAPQHRILAALSLASLIAAVAFTTSLASGRAGAQSRAASYPRNETLITIGAQWGPIAGTNPYVGNYAVGMVELVNETLLRYDPLKDKYINWLAKSAKFSGKKVYTVNVRPGIRWSNGQKFTGKDVKFNFRLGRFKTAFWHGLYSTLKSIRAKGLTVTFTFKRTPNYIQWQNLIWNLPMINPAQGGSISNETLTTYSPKNPIGTGPYALDPAGFDATTRVVWKKKAVWWAAQQKLAPSPKPKYVIDLVDTCDGWFIHTLCSCLNNLTPLLNGVGDLENAYLPGVQKYVASGQMRTYYPKKPYNLSGNTAWLTPNTTHKPLDDKRFRGALATSINVPNIVANNYGHLVRPADATGLLPTWNKWVDQKQLKALGFKYSTNKARSLLSAAGYRDTNSDGYVENKDGSPLDLRLAVPQGWSDWENARDMIVSSAKKAGIRIHRDEGDHNHWQSERNSGAFDLVLDNHFQLSDSPWTYYDGIFRLPVQMEQTAANFGRYQSLTAWKLSKQLDKTRPEDVAKRKAIMKKLQKIMLTEVPIIPLWYNGIWAQSQSGYWTNWPSSTSKRNYVPGMWRGYMQMTGIDMITHLKPAPDGD